MLSLNDILAVRQEVEAVKLKECQARQAAIQANGKIHTNESKVQVQVATLATCEAEEQNAKSRLDRVVQRSRDLRERYETAIADVGNAKEVNGMAELDLKSADQRLDHERRKAQQIDVVLEEMLRKVEELKLTQKASHHELGIAQLSYDHAKQAAKDTSIELTAKQQFMTGVRSELDATQRSEHDASTQHREALAQLGVAQRDLATARKDVEDAAHDEQRLTHMAVEASKTAIHMTDALRAIQGDVPSIPPPPPVARYSPIRHRHASPSPELASRRAICDAAVNAANEIQKILPRASETIAPPRPSGTNAMMTPSRIRR